MPFSLPDADKRLRSLCLLHFYYLLTLPPALLLRWGAWGFTVLLYHRPAQPGEACLFNQPNLFLLHRIPEPGERKPRSDLPRTGYWLPKRYLPRNPRTQTLPPYYYLPIGYITCLDLLLLFTTPYIPMLSFTFHPTLKPVAALDLSPRGPIRDASGAEPSSSSA